MWHLQTTRCLVSVSSSRGMWLAADGQQFRMDGIWIKNPQIRTCGSIYCLSLTAGALFRGAVGLSCFPPRTRLPELFPFSGEGVASHTLMSSLMGKHGQGMLSAHGGGTADPTLKL